MLGEGAERRLNSLRDSLPGQTLPGSDGRRYPLGERLGEGGQGWIFRATWNGSIDVVAKVLRPDAVTHDSLARFHREAAVLRTMSQQATPNPHVVRYYDHASATLSVPGTSDVWTFPFTVLEYVDGETLADTLAREKGAREKGAGLGVDRTRHILRHIVLALRDVHAQNIIHRDLKPSNVLIERVHGREIAKVTDFGLAKVFDDNLHRTAALAGATVGYAPPEQFEKGNPRVGKPTDVFSLATIFFEMLTGEPCFPFGDPLLVLHALMQGNRATFAKSASLVPAEVRGREGAVEALDAVLSRALQMAPESRYASVTDFHDAVEDVLATVGTGGALRLSDRPLPPVPRARVSSAAGGASASGEGVTMLADASERLSGHPVTRSGVGSEAPPGPLSAPSGAAFQWHVSTAAAWPRPLRTIALTSDGRAAVGVGPDGLGLWNAGAWVKLELPRFVPPSNVEALAWFGNHIVVAGASPVVYLRSFDGNYTPVTFNVPGLVFHGASADAQGVVLAGEQVTHAGPIGVLATMTLQAAGMLALSWAITRLGAPLRAATRVGDTVLGCGDYGTVAALRDGRLTTMQLCPQPLLAIAPAGDGAAIVVGGGGFVFHVGPSLDARLEAVQTTRSLTAVARGEGGALYCGGEDRRVLRKESQGWVRAGCPVGNAGAMVRAMVATASGVAVFCDDGSVLEGVSLAPPKRG